MYFKWRGGLKHLQDLGEGGNGKIRDEGREIRTRKEVWQAEAWSTEKNPLTDQTSHVPKGLRSYICVEAVTLHISVQLNSVFLRSIVNHLNINQMGHILNALIKLANLKDS